MYRPIGYVLSTVCSAVLYGIALRKARKVGYVMAVELGARSLSDHTRPVSTSQILQPRPDTLRHPRTPRTFPHHRT